MLFHDKVVEKINPIRVEIDRLLEIAKHSQLHKSDLLLLHLNGSYRHDIFDLNQRQEEKFIPYVIGPDFQGHSEEAHYKFINKYRSLFVYPKTFNEYQKEIESLIGNSEKRDSKIDEEEKTIQLEMLIYLKFWEADLIIKKLYQFVRIVNGESYDWHFKIANISKDIKHGATGFRASIIEGEIAGKLNNHSPYLSNLITEVYKSQIRNSIAHSNYSFLERSIHLNNFKKDDPYSQLEYLDFDEWIDIFHNVIALHNEYIRLDNLLSKYYIKNVGSNNHTEILVKDKEGKSKLYFVEYLQRFNVWKYTQY